VNLAGALVACRSESSNAGHHDVLGEQIMHGILQTPRHTSTI
jgi:hypothetical protein